MERHSFTSPDQAGERGIEEVRLVHHSLTNAHPNSSFFNTAAASLPRCTSGLRTGNYKGEHRNPSQSTAHSDEVQSSSNAPMEDTGKPVRGPFSNPRWSECVHFWSKWCPMGLKMVPNVSHWCPNGVSHMCADISRPAAAKMVIPVSAGKRILGKVESPIPLQSGAYLQRYLQGAAWHLPNTDPETLFVIFVTLGVILVTILAKGNHPIEV